MVSSVLPPPALLHVFKSVPSSLLYLPVNLLFHSCCFPSVTHQPWHSPPPAPHLHSLLNLSYAPSIVWPQVFKLIWLHFCLRVTFPFFHPSPFQSHSFSRLSMDLRELQGSLDRVWYDPELNKQLYNKDMFIKPFVVSTTFYWSKYQRSRESIWRLEVKHKHRERLREL